ncbi:hypothetical protein ABC426_17465, partial [Lactiplantibacillus plantarum]|uniref:hypothetical protein n=1 Tax=Lactiplantibacillus plantarum TaxID=1590 RepID=UPI001BA7CE58|nr:hypothetical protein [Lactiplantibacillus plantarum]MBS0953058.1 hypothetical protein [Lactiplantibacillus plantarum]
MIANFIHKNVKIEFTDGDIWTGKVINYTIAGDNDPEEESIEFIPANGPGKGKMFEVYEHEIKNIKEI